MADIKDYNNIIKDVIRQYAEERPLPNDLEAELIFDTDGDHYQLVNVGWHNNRRIYGCVLHIDIKNSKVWIQHNGTEIEIAEELVKAGILEEDIVIGFHSPYKRKFTKFAVG